MPKFLNGVFYALAARSATIPVTAVAVGFSTYLSISYAGVTEFGFISLLGTFFLLMPFADLGLGAAVINAVAARQASEGHNRQALDAVRRAIGLLLCVALVIVVSAIALWIAKAWPTILGVPTALAAQTNDAALVVFVIIALTVPFGLGQRLLVANNLTHVAAIFAAAGPVVALATIWVVCSIGAPVMVLAIATPVGILVSSVATTIYGFRRLGWRWAVFRRARLGPAESRVRLWASALPMLVITLGSPVALQSHRLVLAHYGSGADLAEYAVAAQFYAPALSIVTTGALAMWPQFAGDRSNQHRNWRASLVAMALVGGVGGLGFTLLLHPAGLLVSGGAVSISVVLALSFALLILVMSLHQPSAMLLTSSPALRFQAVCMVLLAAVAVPGSVLLIPVLGAAGPPAASAVAVLLTCVIPGVIYARRRVLR